MKRIVVVEDNPDNRLLLRALLDSEYEVLEYASGTEGLQGIEQNNPDLVLLDISLPGMDGREVLSRIRADPNLEGLPVVALTAHAMKGDREQFLALGFDEYLSKPILDAQALLDMIQTLLEPDG